MLAHINARHTAFVSGPEMKSRARLAELKEKEQRFRNRERALKERRSRLAIGPPLTNREHALLFCLSTLYPQKKVDFNPEFLAEQSAFSTVESDGDGYPLEYQRAKALPLADVGAPPPAELAPSEAVDAAEESMSSVGLHARAETDEAGESDAAEELDAAQ